VPTYQRSRDVCPRTSSDYGAHSLGCHVEPASKCSLRFTSNMAVTDSSYVRNGKFGHAVPFASVASSVTQPVHLVFFSRAPAQVHQTVILPPAGAVSGFLPVRTRANERFQHEVMYQPRFTGPGRCATRKVHTVLAVVAKARLQQIRLLSRSPLVPQALYPTLIANFVASFVSKNGQPAFGHDYSLPQEG
jgi:hypothetical protein